MESGAATGIPITGGAAFSKHLQTQFDVAIDSVRRRLRAKPMAKRPDGDWILAKFVPVQPGEKFADLERLIHARMEDRTLMEILVNADGAARFMRRFGPAARVAPKMQNVKQ